MLHVLTIHSAAFTHNTVLQLLTIQSPAITHNTQCCSYSLYMYIVLQLFTIHILLQLLTIHCAAVLTIHRAAITHNTPCCSYLQYTVLQLLTIHSDAVTHNTQCCNYSQYPVLQFEFTIHRAAVMRRWKWMFLRWSVWEVWWECHEWTELGIKRRVEKLE